MRSRNPVDPKPVMLSRHVPLADAHPVPPEANGIGGEIPEIAPPVIVAFDVAMLPSVVVPVTVSDGTVNGPVNMAPASGT